MRLSVSVILLTVATLVLGSASRATAQPLVTEGLSVYYSFDSVDEDGLWADGSGNNLHGLTTLGEGGDANEDGLPDIRFDADNKVRGAGSAWFDTDPNVKEDYIAICDPAFDYAETCEIADSQGLIPVNGFTFAAWVNVLDVGGQHSILQFRSDNGGFTHTQIQETGNLRITLRGDANSSTIVNYNEPPGGSPVEWGTWVHVAGTYQKPDPNGVGEYAIYYNGELMVAGDANGNVAGDPDLEVLGNWGMGAYIGMVPDFQRQLVGHIDEFYLFTRALSEEEVQTLYSLEGGGVAGDFDGNDTLDAADIDALSAEVRAGTNGAAYDLNGDSLVNGDDRNAWVNDLKKTYFGDSNLDGEFNSGDLVFVFTSGEYEDGVAGNSGWGEGDWDGNAEFDSSDFVTAFAAGGYENGPRAAVSAVPEPSTLLLTLLGGLGLLARRRR